jgi:hypothetical protein
MARRTRPSGAQLAHAVADDMNARLDVHVSPVVSAETEALYRSLSRLALVALREAFVLDRQDVTATAATRAFCDGRIALIDRVLRKEGSS